MRSVKATFGIRRSYKKHTTRDRVNKKRHIFRSHGLLLDVKLGIREDLCGQVLQLRSYFGIVHQRRCKTLNLHGGLAVTHYRYRGKKALVPCEGDGREAAVGLEQL